MDCLYLEYLYLIKCNIKEEFMSKKPIIGISSSVIVDDSGNFAGYKRAYVNKDYVDAVVRAWVFPLIIPFTTDK